MIIDEQECLLSVDSSSVFPACFSLALYEHDYSKYRLAIDI